MVLIASTKGPEQVRTVLQCLITCVYPPVQQFVRCQSLHSRAQTVQHIAIWFSLHDKHSIPKFRCDFMGSV